VFSDSYGYKLGELEEARKNGYFVVMVFVGIADVELGKSRVVRRVERGGHDVRPDAQVERFDRVFENALKATTVAELSLFIDNSKESQAKHGSHRPVAVYKDGQQISRHKEMPTWWWRMLPPTEN
jgi:predicted ABC-type ATPase